MKIGFDPTPMQAINAAMGVVGPALFMIACVAGYNPSNRVLGIVIGLIGIAAGQNWMSLTETRESKS
jgi:hypothetical protein